MTRPADKEQELRYVRHMIAGMPDLGELTITDADRESPDCQLTSSDGRTVGLEVVRAMDEGVASGRGVKSKMTKRIVKDLRMARVNAHINFSISDGAAGLLALPEMKATLAAEINALVRLATNALREAPVPGKVWRRYQRYDSDAVDETGFVCWRDASRDNGSHDLDGRGVEFCTSVLVRPYSEPLATCGVSSRGQPRRIIQDAIDAKASLLPEYKAKGDDELWLLVVGSSGQGGALDISAAEGEFISPFERTFFLEAFEGKCIELKVRKRAL